MSILRFGKHRLILGAVNFALWASLTPYAGAVATQQHAATQAPVALEFEFSKLTQTRNGQLVLRGADATHQINIALRGASGSIVDATRSVRFTAEPQGVLQVDSGGRISVRGNGVAVVRARHEASGLSAEMTVVVEDAQSVAPINFGNKIVPIFTKASCNSGGCHGKAGGQNGFRLSLLGFEPDEDYEHLVKEARGRRLFPAAPENSLLLVKGIGLSPHGGGKRLDPASDDYRLLLRWIQQGMPYG